MYSVVLMMAITTGGDVPDCHRHHNTCGCTGTYTYGGCYGSTTCYGGCYGSAPYGGCYGGAYMAPPTKEELKKMPEKKEPPKEPLKEQPKKDQESINRLVAPGKIVVSMPADARFTIDDYTSPARSDTHIVVSAPLRGDETRTYVLKAEVIRDGKVQTMQESVTVHAGEEAKVTLTLPTAVASR